MIAIAQCEWCGRVGNMDLEVIRHFSITHRKTMHYCNWRCLKSDMTAQGEV